MACNIDEPPKQNTYLKSPYLQQSEEPHIDEKTIEMDTDTKEVVKGDTFPFQATMSREHFDKYVAENLDNIEANNEFIKDLRDKRKMNLLHCAVINNCVELISVLIKEYKININDVDIDGYSALFYAIKCKNEQCLKSLLSFQPTIDLIMIGWRGKTILHECAERNATTCCQLILEYIKENMVDKLHEILFSKYFNEFTAVDIAKAQNKSEILLLLNNFINNNCKDFENEIVNDFVVEEKDQMQHEYDLKVEDTVDKSINKYESLDLNTGIHDENVVVGDDDTNVSTDSKSKDNNLDRVKLSNDDSNDETIEI
eukprot:395600_1